MVALDNVTLQVGGITPFTTIDFPGRLAAVIFCQGCPWHCVYCHNRHLLPADGHGRHSWNDIVTWLKTRSGLLEGIVFSGGEPLLQRQLGDAIRQVRQNGFDVALHTSGVYPDRLKKVLPLVEWIGLDIKAPFDEYEVVTGGGNGWRTRESLRHILDFRKPHELRCTVDPRFFTVERAEKMARQLAELGADHMILQPCRDETRRRSRPVSEEIMNAVKRFLPSVAWRS